MNILFIVPSTYPDRGGVERVTYLVAKENRYKNVVSFAMTKDADINKDGVFKSVIFFKGLTLKKFLDFLQKNKIDLIVNQLSYDMRIVDFLQKIQILPIISCFHGSPTFYKDEMDLLLFERHIPLFCKMRIRALFKKAIYPFYDPYSKAFNLSCQISERFILLSERFLEPFIRTYNLQRFNNLSYVNNPLSLDVFFEGDYSVKKKTVLVVCRLSDMKKRVSLILKIWKEIEQKNASKDWDLIIVGGGKDETVLRKLVETLQLKRCTFVGPKINVVDYYRMSSIFLMTSLNEGWGLTVTEAMQMGCVPVAFNTYLSLSEIISDGEDGFIIPDNEFQTFCTAVISLMQDEVKRKHMAYNGIKNAKKFSLSSISDKWYSLFKVVVDEYKNI